jgi:hypothetical protein
MREVWRKCNVRTDPVQPSNWRSRSTRVCVTPPGFDADLVVRADLAVFTVSGWDKTAARSARSTRGDLVRGLPLPLIPEEDVAWQKLCQYEARRNGPSVDEPIKSQQKTQKNL